MWIFYITRWMDEDHFYKKIEIEDACDWKSHLFSPKR